MKSKATKTRLTSEAVRLAMVREERERDPHLMALYLMFVPGSSIRTFPKFTDDQYGNRIRTESISA